MRDDFPKRTIETLAKRVGNRCSNPNCGQATSGPHTEDAKVVNIGVAAHITAASAGGPRYDASLLPRERQSIRNGIWLCQTCSKLVDSDESRYPVTLLRGWKKEAEDRSSRLLCSRGSEALEHRDGSLGSHDIEFSVDGWEVSRYEGNRPGDVLGFYSSWREGDILYSCKIRLRNRLRHDEELHHLRIEFRQGEHVLLADAYPFDQEEVTLPARKWTTLEVDHGLHDRSVFDRSESVWFSARTVGDNELHAWQIARLVGAPVEIQV
jgi:hypothetical protein